MVATIAWYTNFVTRPSSVLPLCRIPMSTPFTLMISTIHTTGNYLPSVEENACLELVSAALAPCV